MQDENNEDKSKKKKKTNSKNQNANLGDWWTFRKFDTKQDLEQFLKDQKFKPRSGENKSCYQRCRYCKSSTPNCSKHMIQIYYDCDACFEKKNRIVTNGPNCIKSNICENTKRYELLTCHKTQDLSPELIISDLTELIETSATENALDDLDDLVLSVQSLSISRKDQYYKMKDEFYYWKMEEVFPCQTFISVERIFIKMNENLWVEFQGGKKHKEFTMISSERDKVVLRSNDEIYSIDSNELVDVLANQRKYDGDWLQEVTYQRVSDQSFLKKVKKKSTKNLCVIMKF